MPPRSPFPHGSWGRLGERAGLLRWGEVGTAQQQPFPLPGLYFPAHSGHFPGCRPSTRFTLRPRLPGAVSGKAGTPGWFSPPHHCPCLGCFTPVPGQGTEVAVPSLCFQPACSCRSARSSFHSGFCVARENDKL